MMASQVMLTVIKILSNIIMNQYNVVLDRVIYQDYKFLVNQMKKKLKDKTMKKQMLLLNMQNII